MSSTGQRALKAIETVHNGYRFRSRLEARWAVFFETLGVTYQYEAEGYDLNGTWYLPDFWLPQQACFIEIKGASPTQEESMKASSLAAISGRDVFIFWPDIGLSEYATWSDILTVEGDGAFAYLPDGQGNASEDNLYHWCVCPTCGRVGITFEGRSDRLPCKTPPAWSLTTGALPAGCPRSPHGDKGKTADHPRILAALTAARQARFGR